MLDTFKERLKAKSTAAGAQNLTTARLDAMSARLIAKFPDLRDEAEIDAKIDELYDAEMLKELAALDDFRKAQAARKAAVKKPEDPEKKEDTKKDNPADEEPAWFKAYRESTDAKLNAFEREKALKSIGEKAKELLKDVPASYWKGRPLPENEEGLQGFVTEITTDYTAFQQELANQGFAQITKPKGGSGASSKEPTKEEIKAITDKII